MTSSTKHSLWALVALALVACAVLERFTVRHEALLGVDVLERFPPYATRDPGWPHNILDTDPVLCTFPREAVMGESLRAGHGAPRWEPALGTGEPVSLVNATAPDYPPWRAAFTLLPAWVAHGVLVVLHLALAMAGAFLLARRRGIGVGGALVAALVYGLSGHLSVWLELDLWTIAAAFLPWALLGLEIGGGRGIALSAVALGASILGGHLQVAALGCALALVWKPRRAVFALALGLMLGAPRLLPALVELQESSRERIPFDRYFAETGSLSPSRLRLLVVPDREDPILRNTFLEASTTQGKHEPQANAQELRFAPGTAALALLLVAAALRRNRKLVFLAASLLVLAMPTPLAWPLWKLAPGFGATTPTRVLCLFPLVAGLLAGDGFEVLRERPRHMVATFGALLGFIVVDGVTGGGFGTRAIMKPLGLATAGLAAALMAEGASPRIRRAMMAVVLGLVAFDLAEATTRYNPAGPPELAYPKTPLVTRLQDAVGDGRVLTDRAGAEERWVIPTAIAPDIVIPNSLRNVSSYGSSHPGRYSHLRDALVPRPSRQWLNLDTIPASWRDALGVRAVLVGGGRIPLVAHGLVASGPNVYKNPNALPRARVFPESAVHVVATEALALELAKKIDPRGELIVEGATPHAGVAAVASGAEILEDTPERVHIKARASEPSVLVLMDAWASGWSVTVDEKPAEVLHADLAFRGVRLDPGDHDVVFSFAQPLWIQGVALAAVALLVAVLLVLSRGARPLPANG